MTISATLFSTQLLADATGSTAEIQSVWDFVLRGGPMMIPIGLCSLIALTIIVERLVSLRRQNVIPPDFLPGLQAIMNDQPERAKALEYCENHDAPLAAIFAAAVRRLSESVELLEKHVQETGQRVVMRLRKYLRPLAVIASVCPLMGLLGTIFGMIKAFQTVATSGDALGKTELLAEGIYQAMITTAAGLLVAIPAMIAYHWLSSRIDGLVAEMDRMTVEFVEEHAYANNSESGGLRIEADGDASESGESAAVS